MRRIKCVNFHDCSDFATSEIRDPYFAETHELAFMPVCPTCLREYLALPKSLGFYERPEMQDTMVKTADIALRFSSSTAVKHEPINVVGITMLNLATRCIIFSDATSAGNKFAAKTLGTYMHAMLSA